jgi:hypothetical protein
MIGRRDDDGKDGSSSLDDEDGTDDGGSGVASSLTPKYRREPERPLSEAHHEEDFDETEVPEILHVPSLGDLDEVEELENGYRLGYFRGEWHLYDDDGEFVGAFMLRGEDAEAEAYRRKPWGRLGI